MASTQINFVNNSIQKCKCTIALGMLTALLGCAHTSETFDCKFEKGVGCRSITEVDQMVNRGEIKGIPSEEGPALQSPVAMGSPPKISSSLEKKLSALEHTSEQVMLERIPEQHLRLWLAAFQDEQGNFHEASIVHTVLKPGLWQLKEGI